MNCYQPARDKLAIVGLKIVLVVDIQNVNGHATRNSGGFPADSYQRNMLDIFYFGQSDIQYNGMRSSVTTPAEVVANLSRGVINNVKGDRFNPQHSKCLWKNRIRFFYRIYYKM